MVDVSMLRTAEQGERRYLRATPLITVIPHTTRLRGSAFEVAVPVSFLKPGAFLVQGVTTFPTVRALHCLGALPAFAKVFDGLLRWLGQSQEP
jgi:mRNA-degrading endonuclease toxin of MazEF toxin-antitoxin module